MHTCPVCGYNEMEEPAKNYVICECCGTEFGYDDFTKSHDQLRQEWIQKEAPWTGIDVLCPDSWSRIRQLHNIDYKVTQADLILMGVTDLANDALARAKEQIVSMKNASTVGYHKYYHIQPSSEATGTIFDSSEHHIKGSEFRHSASVEISADTAGCVLV